MKDLGNAKKNLGIKLVRDRRNGQLFVSQCDYLKKILEKYAMKKAKPVKVPLGQHFKLSA